MKRRGSGIKMTNHVKRQIWGDMTWPNSRKYQAGQIAKFEETILYLEAEVPGGVIA